MGADVGGYVFEAHRARHRHARARRADPRDVAPALTVPRRDDQPSPRQPRGLDRRGRARDRRLALPASSSRRRRAPSSRRTARGSSRRRRSSASCSCASPPPARATGSNRAAFLGLAAGTLFGTSAVLTKAFVHYLGGGVAQLGPALGAVRARGELDHRSRPRAERVPNRRARRGRRRRAGHATAHRSRVGVGLLDEKLGISGSIATIMLIAALVAMLWGVLTLAAGRAPDVLVPPPALADG